MTIRTSAALLAACLLPGAAAAQPAEACDVRIWQSRDFASEAPANYGAYGLIGAIAGSVHDSRYPEGSTEARMDVELRADVIIPMISKLPWAAITKASNHSLTFVAQPITHDAIKAIRASKQRNSEAAAPCAVEFYMDRTTFLGGMVQSNLMSEFTIRHFNGPTLRTVNGKSFKKVKGFPAKDEAGVDAASASLRAAFADNLGDFVAKKFPVKGR
jgi:hypothetical protein